MDGFHDPDRCHNAVVPIDRYAGDRQVLTEMTEAELLRHARNFMWLAKFQPSEVGRKTFDIRRDMARPSEAVRDYDARFRAR